MGELNRSNKKVRPMMRKPTALVAITALALTSAPVFASDFQDLDALDVAVAASMGAEIGQPGGARAPVDRRLKLRACPELPTVSGPVLGAAVVRCQSIGWSIRVPLMLEASAQRTSSAASADREARDAVTRGQAVRLTVEGKGYSLSRTMIADRSGRIGDMISVRADRRAKPILARVTGVGEVTVPANR